MIGNRASNRQPVNVEQHHQRLHMLVGAMVGNVPVGSSPGEIAREENLRYGADDASAADSLPSKVADTWNAQAVQCRLMANEQRDKFPQYPKKPVQYELSRVNGSQIAGSEIPSHGPPLGKPAAGAATSQWLEKVQQFPATSCRHKLVYYADESSQQYDRLRDSVLRNPVLLRSPAGLEGPTYWPSRPLVDSLSRDG